MELNKERGGYRIHCGKGRRADLPPFALFLGRPVHQIHYTHPPLRKHQEIQKNDGQTGSRCLDKAVLARDVRYQPSQE